jgi:hypothetical protein
MPLADLRRMIVDMALRNDFVEDYGSYDPARPDVTTMVAMLLEEHLDEVQKDWSKIDFSTENMDVVAEKVTPAGVPYLQIRAGGDWETPLSCIIYFDGKKLRGYVPKDGNSYNHRAKAAFGNNDDDRTQCVKQFGAKQDHEEGFIDVEPDMVLVELDIAKRIEAKGEYAYAQGPVTSKAATKAKKQAIIESTQDLSGKITRDIVYAVISLAAGAAYVHFELRSSRRELTADEANRLVDVPARLEKTVMRGSGEILWYSPMGCYPVETLRILEAAGFVKAPDNDLSPYEHSRTVVLR